MKTKNKKKNNVKRKKLTSKIKIGQTLESNDLFLPHNKNKPPKPKKRPVITAFINQNNELGVIPGSTQDTRNTRYYGKHGIKYYRNVIEIEDNEGKPIKVGKKFQLTDNCTELPKADVDIIIDNVVNHSRFASENRKKVENFENRHKKRVS